MVNVLVNGIPLLAPLTGIGHYIRHLFGAMNALPEVKLRFFYGLYCDESLRLPTTQATPSAHATYRLAKRLLPRPRTLKRVAESISFRFHATRSGKEGLYHEPNFLPLPYRGPLVLTVHDLSCFDHPETHPVERVRLMHKHLPRALERADHVIVDSVDAGQRLMATFGLPASHVTVTHLAADARFHPRLPAELVRPLSAVGLEPGRYVLCVGTLEPRKNLGTLFDAYAGLPDAVRQQFPLVVAGMAGWHTEGLLDNAAQLARRGELRLLGYVPDALLPSVYAGAAAFAYPSRYEGFGLPALEAMASGVPVLTANRTSLPEVVGDAGLMVDPDDVDGMREQLQRLLDDRIFAERLGQAGLARSRSFSWDRCAQETFSVYEKVLRQRGIAR